MTERVWTPLTPSKTHRKGINMWLEALSECRSTTGKYRLGHGFRDPAVTWDALWGQFAEIDPG